jgi:SnoaL-like protein
MSTLVEQLVAYAVAFEQSFADDDWHRLESHFAPEAEREVLGGGMLAYHSVGREHVIADLKRNVEDMDRRFDLRIPEIVAGPEERDGAVWMDWRLTFRRAGLPDLQLTGSHGTWHRDGVITRIEEHVSDADGVAVEAYLRKHDAALEPAPPAEAMRIGRMRSLVETYARAKSRADVAGAMAVCAESFVLDTPSFGIASRNRDETTGHLAAFFHAFPDYGVTLDRITFGDAAVGCWGTARMTLRGPFLHLAPTNRTAELPVFSGFEFVDDRLARETFFIDVAMLSDGIGVPLADMRAALAQIRAAA